MKSRFASWCFPASSPCCSQWRLGANFTEEIMLVLTRQRNEWIDIGPNVSIQVVEIRGRKVRLGIVAPDEVSIHRREVTEAIQRDLDAGKPATRMEDVLDAEENHKEANHARAK
jgi:carbon storage regulator